MAQDDRAIVDRLLKRLRGATPGAAATPAPTVTPSTGAGFRSMERPAIQPRAYEPAAARVPRAWLAKAPSVGIWARVLLAAIFGLALIEWPYAHDCGAWLYVYLSVVVTVIVTGMWAAVFSWQGRAGWAHVIALATILWGITLAAQEAVPRMGDTKNPVPWQCSEPRSSR